MGCPDGVHPPPSMRNRFQEECRRNHPHLRNDVPKVWIIIQFFKVKVTGVCNGERPVVRLDKHCAIWIRKAFAAARITTESKERGDAVQGIESDSTSAFPMGIIASNVPHARFVFPLGNVQR